MANPYFSGISLFPNVILVSAARWHPKVPKSAEMAYLGAVAGGIIYFKMS